MTERTPYSEDWQQLLPTTLTHLRLGERYTQQTLASSLGISQARIARIEKRGAHRMRVQTLASYIEEGLGYRLMLVAEDGDKRYLIY